MIGFLGRNRNEGCGSINTRICETLQEGERPMIDLEVGNQRVDEELFYLFVNVYIT